MHIEFKSTKFKIKKYFLSTMMDKYEKEIGRTLYKIPIGEDQSIAIIKDSRS